MRHFVIAPYTGDCCTKPHVRAGIIEAATDHEARTLAATFLELRGNYVHADEIIVAPADFQPPFCTWTEVFEVVDPDEAA